MRHKTILVVAGNHKEFLWGCREKIREYAQKLGEDPAYVFSQNRLRVNGVDYLYMHEPDSMRGLEADEVQYWGTYEKRSTRELELFRIMGNSRIKKPGAAR